MFLRQENFICRQRVCAYVFHRLTNTYLETVEDSVTHIEDYVSLSGLEPAM